MKSFLYSLLIFLGPFYYGSLYGHGFARETLVSVSDGWLYIEQIAHAKKPYLIDVSSYDVRSKTPTTQPIKSISKNEVNCHFCIGFDASRENDIRCSPSQEFYSTALAGWISAVDVRLGEPLLSRDGESYYVKHIELVHELLTVYSIEVPITHTFSESHEQRGLVEVGMRLQVFKKMLDITFEVDAQELLTEGSNQIHTIINGCEFTIRVRCVNGVGYLINGFAGYSERVIGNLINFFE